MSNRLEDKLDEVREDLHNLDTKVQVLSEKFLMHMEQDTRNLENISHSLESITERLGDYNATLIEHIRRSEALEESNELLKAQLGLYKKEQDVRLEKLEAPQKWIKTTLVVIAAVVTILTFLEKIKL
jgi:DNA repair exonuclease SbcCD ATPase subunit